RSTLRPAVGPRATTTALPVTSRGRNGEPVPVPVGPGPAGGVAVGVEAGWTVEARGGDGTERVRTGEHADTTDAASQSTTTVRARIAIRFTACHTLSGSLRPFSPERHPRNAPGKVWRAAFRG